jgi:hypothetical protein
MRIPVVHTILGRGTLTDEYGLHHPSRMVLDINGQIYGPSDLCKTPDGTSIPVNAECLDKDPGYEYSPTQTQIILDIIVESVALIKQNYANRLHIYLFGETFRDNNGTFT